MENIIAKIEKQTRKVYLSKSVIGNDGENLQEKLVFSFDTFVNGTARLELNKNNTQSYIMLTKVNNTYELPIKSIITKVGKLELQLVITEGINENEIPVFKSNTFYMIINPSINAEIEEPEEYPQWIDVANTKLNEIDEALDDLQDKVDSGYFKGEKGDPGQTGQNGKDAKINGVNTLTLTAGDNITLTQTGNELEISATGGSGGTSDYIDLSNKPKINNVELSGNKTTSDLGLFSGNYNDLTNKPNLSNYQEKIDSTNKLNADLVDDTTSTNKFVTSAEKTTWNSKYDKPSTGIPKTDLAQAIQDVLDDVSNKEDTSNKVTTIDSTSTDTEYASAKAIYDLVGSISGGGDVVENFDASSSNPFVFEGKKKGIYIARGNNSTFKYKMTEAGNVKEITSTYVLCMNFMYDYDELVSGGVLGYALYINLTSNNNNGKLAMGYIKKYDTYISMPFQDWYTIGKVVTTYEQTFEGVKKFTVIPQISSYTAPTSNTQLVAKKYVDDSIASAITTTLNGSY